MRVRVRVRVLVRVRVRVRVQVQVLVQEQEQEQEQEQVQVQRLSGCRRCCRYRRTRQARTTNPVLRMSKAFRFASDAWGVVSS